MELADLTYLQAAVRWRSFVKAAESIGVQTSTVSRRVGRLEGELGVLLLERSHIGLRLTPVGMEVLFRLQKAMVEFDAIKLVGQSGGKGATGLIRLGLRMAPLGEPLSTLLGDWRESAPTVDITVTELSDDDFATDLEERKVDVVLLPTHILWPRAASYPLYRESLVVVMPPDHPLAMKAAVKWTDLHDATILIQGLDGSRLQREFLTNLMGSGFRFKSHRASEQTLFALAAHGFGLTISCEGHAKSAPTEVVWRHIDESSAWLENSLVWLPELEDAAIGRFVAFMRDAARSRNLV